ncbi:hypothetical protein ACWEPC_08755 [Nonomuraea sp. NPDC004297]
MPSPARRRGIGGLVTVITATLLLTTSPSSAAQAEAVPLIELGSDAYANATSQHGTQAGPDTFHWNSTIVAAQQAGRFHDGGASGIAFATSADNGATWAKGTLPGLTTFGGGPYARVSDPSVAFDAEHGVWLITSLALAGPDGTTGAAVVTSRSADGGRTWSAPVTAAAGGDLDKSWVVCDNGADSPYRGTCYAVFDDHGAGNAIRVSRSSDGGLTWVVAGTTATGLGGQPVVRPNGAVVVPYLGSDGRIRSFRSRDGGASWGESVPVAQVERHPVAGGLRAAPLPSAEIDAGGTVYVVWHDCRFQVDCAGNDIVLSRSSDGAALALAATTACHRAPDDDHHPPGPSASPPPGAPTHTAPGPTTHPRPGVHAAPLPGVLAHLRLGGPAGSPSGVLAHLRLGGHAGPDSGTTAGSRPGRLAGVLARFQPRATARATARVAARAALAAWYASQFATPQARAVADPSAGQVRAAVTAGIVSLPALQGALTARAGAPAAGLALAAVVPLARRLARKLSPT